MKTWEDWANKVESGCITRGLSIKAIEAYKQALEAEVEKRLEAIRRTSRYEPYLSAKFDTYDEILQLIETVKPKDE